MPDCWTVALLGLRLAAVGLWVWFLHQGMLRGPMPETSALVGVARPGRRDGRWRRASSLRRRVGLSLGLGVVVTILLHEHADAADGDGSGDADLGPALLG